MMIAFLEIYTLLTGILASKCNSTLKYYLEYQCFLSFDMQLKRENTDWILKNRSFGEVGILIFYMSIIRCKIFYIIFVPPFIVRWSCNHHSRRRLNVKYDLEAYADCESTVILNQEQFYMLLLHLFVVMGFYYTKSKAYWCVMLSASHG